jgi:hypothetical protein
LEQIQKRIDLCSSTFVSQTISKTTMAMISNFKVTCLVNNLRVFKNRIQRRIFGPKRDEDGEWRKLQNEELHSLYRSHYIVRVIKSRRWRWAGHLERMEEGRSAFKILTGKPTGKGSLGRPRSRWKDNIRMDLKEIGINTRN